MTRLESFLRELTEDKIVELLNGTVGEVLFIRSPWCRWPKVDTCGQTPDDAILPCGNCIRAWLREEVEE